MSGGRAYLLYVAFALGAFALYFLVPRPNARLAARTIGWLSAVLAGGLALYVSRNAGLDQNAFFYVFAAAALLAGVRVITHPKPVYSAVYFVVVVLAVAAILLLHEAEFLAVALVVIYAGAILVTYLFVIMLAQQPGAPVYDRRAREPFGAVVAAFLLTGAIAGQSASLGEDDPRATPPARTAVSRDHAGGASAGNTAAIGVAIMTRYPVALEIGGVLLLISMVGAVALSRKRVPTESGRQAPSLGQIGKEVEPF